MSVDVTRNLVNNEKSHPMPAPRHRVVYLSIEETSREFESRVLIASQLAAAGVSAVIAPQATIWHSLADIPPGLVLFKGNNAIQARPMKVAKRAGHVTASIEEEALGIRDRREIKRLYDPSIPDVCDLIFVHGDNHAVALEEKFPGIGDRLFMSRNPRIDLLRPPYDQEIRARAKDLVERYGRYVLINTNLASINYRGGDTYAYYQLCCAVGVISDESRTDYEDFRTWCDWEHHNLAATVGFIKAIRELDLPWRIILRPHPSEALEPWERVFAGTDDVLVIREGNHLAWTAGAEVLVHTSCTTGFEAFVLGTPAISLCTSDNPWNDMCVSNLTSRVCRSANEAAALVGAFAGGDDSGLPDAERYRETLAPHYLLFSPETSAEFLTRAMCGVMATDASKQGALRFDFSPQEAPESKIDLNMLDPVRVADEIARQGKYIGAVVVQSLGLGVVLVRPTAAPPPLVIGKSGGSQTRKEPRATNTSEFLAKARDALRNKKVSSALAASKAASVMAPENVEAPQLLSRSLHMLSRGEEVSALLRRLEILIPNQSKIAVAITRDFLTSGEAERAIAWAKIAIARGPNPAPAERLLDLARALRAGDRLEEADEVLDRLAESNKRFLRIKEILNTGVRRASFLAEVPR